MIYLLERGIYLLERRAFIISSGLRIGGCGVVGERLSGSGCVIDESSRVVDIGPPQTNYFEG